MQKKTVFKSQIEENFGKFFSPIYIFIKSQTTAGILLFFSVIIAIALFNSPWRYLYENFLNTSISIKVGKFSYVDSLVNSVNDILMVLFFFLIGLEIKREFLVGELRKAKLRSFIIITALGGTAFPAIIYWIFNYHGDFANGWGIPMATDTAFSIGLLALLGNRIPKNLFILLIALAIVDDIAGVLVLVFFQGENLSFFPISEILISLAALIAINIVGIRSPIPYFILGVILWIFLKNNGLPAASIAGLLVAFTVPARPRYTPRIFSKMATGLIKRFKNMHHDKKHVLENGELHLLLEDLRGVSLKTTTPLQHWHYMINTPVGIVIIPLFGLLNAGIVIDLASMHELIKEPLWLSFGLIIGKFIGIVSMAWLALKLKIGELPNNVKFKHIIGLGFVCGIGFTMSITIASAAFGEGSHALMLAKLSIITTSLLSIILATLWFCVVCRK